MTLNHDHPKSQGAMRRAQEWLDTPRSEANAWDRVIAAGSVIGELMELVRRLDWLAEIAIRENEDSAARLLPNGDNRDV